MCERDAHHWRTQRASETDRTAAAPMDARVGTVASGTLFKKIWQHRALLAADGWYEWVKDETGSQHKQPYFIRLRRQRGPRVDRPGYNFLAARTDRAGDRPPPS
ncbi:SOS response-associated peptidase family protein [Pseudomonas sp. MMS21 TM103]|uniref:SOS response-associated peptidase family protein n=1 Tax=Pseudomonas sp. MMS21 TM103 TaxID=2886506 RepID=UPI002ED51526